MKIISLVPSSRVSRLSHDDGSQRAGSRKKGGSHPSRRLHPLSSSPEEEEEEDYSGEEDDDYNDFDDYNGYVDNYDDNSYTEEDFDDRYQQSDGRDAMWDMNQREAPPPSSSSKRKSGKKKERENVVDSRGTKASSKRGKSRQKHMDEQDYSSKRPSSERIHREDRKERQEQSHKRPTSARSLPMGGGPRQYPKEKWVPNPPKDDDDDEGLVSVASSSDGFLQNYARYGKYQVDRFSMVEPKLLDYDEERYGVRTPSLFNNSSSDSDSGIARWRSEDEGDDDDGSEADWDMAMYNGTQLHASAGGGPKGGTKPPNSKNNNDDEEETLESSELLHTFDGSKVQFLTDDSLLSETSNSITEGIYDRAYPDRKKKKKDTKKKNDAAKAVKDKLIDRIVKKKGEQHKKNTDPAKGKKSGREASAMRKPFRDELPNEPLPPTQDPRKSKIEFNRTLSTMSNSVPFAPEEEMKSGGANKGIPNRKNAGGHERAKSKKGHPSKKKSSPPPNRKNHVDDDESFSESEEENEDVSDNTNSSSGSLSTRAQMAFRQKKREEHRRWLQERGRSSYAGSDSTTSNDHNGDKRSNVGLFGRFRLGKGKHQEASQTNEESEMNEAEVDPESEPLPWENAEKKKKGLFQRAAAMVMPQKEPVRTVENLPFPNEESYEESLADPTDKYRDILDELPVLTPSGTIKNRHAGKQLLPSTTTVSSLSYTLPEKKKALWRAKKGLGNQIKSIFLKPF